MLNHITVMGRLTKNPELRTTKSGVQVASFTLAVERDFKDADGEKATDFLDCVAWKNTAEFVSKYFTKGRMAIVSGRLQIKEWMKDGGKRRSAEIVADNVYFGDSKKESYEGLGIAGHGDGITSPVTDFEEIDDGELPFNVGL